MHTYVQTKVVSGNTIMNVQLYAKSSIENGEFPHYLSFSAMCYYSFVQLLSVVTLIILYSMYYWFCITASMQYAACLHCQFRRLGYIGS